MIRQYALPLPYSETMSAEDFVVSASNKDAAHLLLSVEPASWPSHALILYGPDGCGKTHLLTIWSERLGAHNLHAGDDVLDKIVRGDPAFALPYTLDNADAVAGNAEHEEWLQHLYNATKTAGLPLVLAARAPSSAWSLSLKDIASRLNSCAHIGIREPDDGLIKDLLLKQFNDRQIKVDQDVIDYLATRLERTGSAIRQTVERLDTQALEAGRRITVPFVQAILSPDTQQTL